MLKRFAVVLFLSGLLSLGSILAAVNPPILINATVIQQSFYTKSVLIYYANESAPNDREAKNYQVLSKWLMDSSTKTGAQLASRWAIDLEKFPRIVDEEIADLKHNTLTAKKPDVGIVIATNRSVRAGFLEIFEPQSKKWRKQPITVREFENYILQSNILANSVVFENILEIVSRVFPPIAHSYLLHVKSHGSVSHAIGTNIASMHETLKRRSVIDAMRESDRRAQAIVAGQSNEAPLGIGILKEDFFGILNRSTHERGMNYPLVFIESCRSGVSLDTHSDLIKNLGYIITSDKNGIVYRNIDHDWLTRGSDTQIFQEYFSQLSQIAIDTHWQQHGIKLDISKDFFYQNKPSVFSRISKWWREL